MRAVEKPLSRWDSRWFYTIATDGYYSSIAGHESPVRFYPLYPVLMAGSAWPRWRDVVVGGGGCDGALACGSRMNACLVILPLLVLAAAKWRTYQRWRPLPALVLTVIGAVAFPFYLWWKFGDPLLYFHTHSWGWPQHPRFSLSFLWDIAKAIVAVTAGGAVPRDTQTMAKAVFPVNIAVLLVMSWAHVVRSVMAPRLFRRPLSLWQPTSMWLDAISQTVATPTVDSVPSPARQSLRDQRHA